MWGTGKPMREFLYVDDMASASIHIMNLPHDEFVSLCQIACVLNVIGTAGDVSIEELSRIMALVVGFDGIVSFDTSKLLDGAPRKLLDKLFCTSFRLAVFCWS